MLICFRSKSKQTRDSLWFDARTHNSWGEYNYRSVYNENKSTRRFILIYIHFHTQTTLTIRSHHHVCIYCHEPHAQPQQLYSITMLYISKSLSFTVGYPNETSRHHMCLATPSESLDPLSVTNRNADPASIERTVQIHCAYYLGWVTTCPYTATLVDIPGDMVYIHIEVPFIHRNEIDTCPTICNAMRKDAP